MQDNSGVSSFGVQCPGGLGLASAEEKGSESCQQKSVKKVGVFFGIFFFCWLSRRVFGDLFRGLAVFGNFDPFSCVW